MNFRDAPYLERASRGPITPSARPFEQGSEDSLLEKVILPALDRAAVDRSPMIRAGAMLALGKVSDLRSFPALFRGFRDRNDDVRRAAILGLAYLGTSDVSLVLERTFLNRKEEPSIRSFAAAALGLSHARAAATSLARALLDRHEKAEVRAAAALALGFLPDEDGTVALLTVLGARRDDARVCSVAATALGRQGDPGRLGVLLGFPLFRDRDPGPERR